MLSYPDELLATEIALIACKLIPLKLLDELDITEEELQRIHRVLFTEMEE